MYCRFEVKFSPVHGSEERGGGDGRGQCTNSRALHLDRAAPAAASIIIDNHERSGIDSRETFPYKRRFYTTPNVYIHFFV